MWRDSSEGRSRCVQKTRKNIEAFLRFVYCSSAEGEWAEFGKNGAQCLAPEVVPSHWINNGRLEGKYFYSALYRRQCFVYVYRNREWQTMGYPSLDKVECRYGDDLRESSQGACDKIHPYFWERYVCILGRWMAGNLYYPESHFILVDGKK